jgi:hypothetical protein
MILLGFRLFSNPKKENDYISDFLLNFNFGRTNNEIEQKNNKGLINDSISGVFIKIEQKAITFKTKTIYLGGINYEIEKKNGSNFRSYNGINLSSL